MAEIIKIKKGLHLQLYGKANKSFKAFDSESYSIKPTDFRGITPRLSVQLGDEIKAGQAIFHDKYREEIRFCAPISGEITDIIRGEKRIIQEVRIKDNKKGECIAFTPQNIDSISKEEVIRILEESGMWTYLIQRPFGIIANKNDEAKAIVISAFDTAPLAPDMDFVVHSQGEDFQHGIDVLAKLTKGKIHLNVHESKTRSKVYLNSKNVQLNHFSGPHPTGNVGIQIHHIDPINKGEVIWTIRPQEIISIGKLFSKGEFNVSRIIAVCGSEAIKPAYHKITLGACIKDLVEGKTKTENIRPISGNVLTGTKIKKDGYIGYYDTQISLIPEGDYYEFISWTLPGFSKYSFSKTFLSWLTPSKKFLHNTNYHGGTRSYVFTGYYDKVLPMNILPLHLIKAILVEDIDKMEELGIYEVSEEDFALVEFIDPSKNNIQGIIGQGLDLIRKEIS